MKNKSEDHELYKFNILISIIVFHKLIIIIYTYSFIYLVKNSNKSFVCCCLFVCMSKILKTSVENRFEYKINFFICGWKFGILKGCFIVKVIILIIGIKSSGIQISLSWLFQKKKTAQKHFSIKV